MIALSIALGVVGLAAVLAARDVAVRWMAEREQAEALDALEVRLRADHAAEHTRSLATLTERLDALEAMAREARSIAIDVRTSAGLRGR